MGTDDLAKKRISANKERRTALKELRKARSVGNRTIFPNILILTEGFSENIYFDELIKVLGLDTVFSRKSVSTSSKGILQEAEHEDLINKDTEKEWTYIFCVFDLDTVKDRSHLELLSRININFTKIIPIYSFPCIEIWFLLHFECNTRPFQSKGKKSIGNIVKSHFINTYSPEYLETNEDVIRPLAHAHDNAIHNSIRLYSQQVEVKSNNPISNIHALVTLLKNMSDRTQEYDYNYEYQSFIEDNL